jgi:hypothetical protein
MSRPDRLKRQPTANTTPQSTPSFDPIDPGREGASQRSEDTEEEITEAVEEKREKVGKNLAVAKTLVLVRNSQMVKCTSK